VSKRLCLGQQQLHLLLLLLLLHSYGHDSCTHHKPFLPMHVLPPTSFSYTAGMAVES
jgi:hypothetical protein